MYRLHGLEPRAGAISLDHVRSLTHPDDFHRLISLMVIDQPSNEARYRIFRADNGEVRNLFTRGEIEMDENGKIIRVSGASMDVTDQLALEEKLKRGQKHFRALVDSNIAGVFFLNYEGRVVEANDAFLALLGYTSCDLPIVWESITPGSEISRDRQARREISRTGTSLPYEKKFISKDGELIPMLIGFARLDSDNVMAFAVDLSERLRAEAYIKQYQMELEETIAERTLELMKSRDRLIENDRLAAVGTLAAGIAHQINNPIGAILNSAEFALLCRDDENSSDEFERALRANLSEAQRCAQIVKSMLLFSRDERTPRWPEDLANVVQRAHRAIAPYAEDHSAIVEIRAPRGTILANISPIEIEQAIVNVLRNAIESGDEDVSISISLTRRDEFAEIEILDDGRGISKEQRDHLFEPFFSTRTNEGGTGLGLSVAHGILTDHGGQIRIDSIPGEGTRVVMMLPIVEPTLERPAVERPAIKLATVERPPVDPVAD
jgi:PAS domain S-box-containing protein